MSDGVNYGGKNILSFKYLIGVFIGLFIHLSNIFRIINVSGESIMIFSGNLYLLQLPMDPFSGFFITALIFPIIMFVIIAIIAITIFKAIFSSHDGPTLFKPMSDVIENIATVAATSGTSQKEAVVLDSIPDVCPNCGAHISISDVKWTGPLTAECPYCGYTFKVKVR